MDWQAWLKVWSELLGLTMADEHWQLDQLDVTCNNTSRLVLECVETQVWVTLHKQILDYELNEVSEELLMLANPSRTLPFVMRLGFNGDDKLLVSFKLSMEKNQPEDLLALYNFFLELI